MNNSTKIIILGFLFLTVTLHSCKKEELPALSTTSISNITAISATSGGNITSDGGAEVTGRGVCWGVNPNPATTGSKIEDNSGIGQFVCEITGLTAGSIYHVRAYANNSVGTAYGADISFVTLGKAPECITQPVTQIASSGATLNGTVNANDLSTTVTFEYGTTTSYGQTITATPNPVTGNTITNVNANLSEILSGTTYHFRVKAVNSIGTTYGSDLTFATLGQAPMAITQSACCTTTTGAILNGIVSANHVSTIITFEYGKTTIYGSSVAASPGSVTGSSNTNVTANLSGLEPGTTYHFRIIAVNSIGTTYGSDLTFATLGQAPMAITQSACCATTTGAILNGVVNANELSTIITFEYGKTTLYGSFVAASPGSVTGSTNTNVTANLAGLGPGTTYHFRIKAVNPVGTTYGDDKVFITQGLAPIGITLPATNISGTGALLNGFVNANDLSTTVTFEYGTTTSYGQTITATQSPVTGNTITNVSAIITGLKPETTYHIRIKVVNSLGTAFGNGIMFSTYPLIKNQIIADHTIVDRFDDIPVYYINEVKKMWFTIPGQSHANAYMIGLQLLESLNGTYDVNVITTGAPEAYTTVHLRANLASWGNYENSAGWLHDDYGEEDWYTNTTGIARTKAGLLYCKSIDLCPSAMGFGWCADLYYGNNVSSAIDPIYGCHWYGASLYGPEGDRCWGLDDGDNTICGNSVNLDTYLNATQQYIDYCNANNISTKIFFTTGPVDGPFGEHVGNYTAEGGYQSYLKHERIRNYVKADATRILFDYADILCYDNDGTPGSDTWEGHTFPMGTIANCGTEQIGHITNAGALRLGKAIWWMLARMAGWDGH